MEFFSTVEFYVIAIVIAVLAIGAALNHNPENNRYTYIFAGEISLSEKNCAESISLSSQDEILTIKHCNVLIPQNTEGIHLRLDVCGNKLKCIEKSSNKIVTMSDDMLSCDITFCVKCLKNKTYNINYECEYNGKWSNITFANNGYSEINEELKL